MAEEKDQPILDVQEAYGKTEQYIIENSKSLSIIAGAIIALVGGYFAWKYLYVADLEESARKEMFKAEQYFEQDSLNQAVNGSVQYKGFVAIADEYGVTPTGNLAQYYAGICFLKKGEYEKAIEHLSEFNSKDEMVGPLATGAIGDAHMELGHTEDAVSYYLKAAEQSKNNFTSPIYLKKAALAYEEKGEYENAVKVYERIKNDFSETPEARDMDKYIARAKAMGGV